MVGLLDLPHFFEGFPCLVEPAVCNQIVHQPQIARPIAGVLFHIVLIVVDHSCVVCDAPIHKYAAGGLAEGRMVVVFLRFCLQSLLCNLCGAVAVHTRTMIIQLRQHGQAASPHGQVKAALFQEAFRIIKVLPGESNIIFHHLFDAAQMGVEAGFKQFVDLDAQGGG